MAITFGGKTAEEAVAAQQQKQYAEEVAKGRVNKPRDPLPVPSGTTAELLSQLGDHMLWLEQFLSEMSELARKRKRLQIQLKDESRQKGRQAAQDRYHQWEDDLIQYMNDVTALEATCDRLWQALPPDVRGHYGMDWNTDPSEPRLIGKAWTHKAKQFQWPVGYCITSNGMYRVEPYVRRELEQVIGTEPVLLGEEGPI